MPITAAASSIEQAWNALHLQWLAIEGDESQAEQERNLVDAMLHLMRAHECIEAAALQTH